MAVPGCRAGGSSRVALVLWSPVLVLLLVLVSGGDRCQGLQAPDSAIATNESERPSEAANSRQPDDETSTSTSTSTSTTTTTTSAPSTNNGRPRIPAVNFTRVAELFEASENETETLAKWRRMDRTLQAGVNGILKVVFPQVVSMASDAKVSGNCQGAILKWILSLKNLRTWSVKMLDAVGKPAAGLLEGSLTLFGNYRQCLSVRAPDEDEIELADGEFREFFRGQYCALELKPPLTAKRPFYSLNSTIESLRRATPKAYERGLYDELAELAMAFHFVSVRADLCVPSLCSRDDIQRVADFLAAKLDWRARVQRCDVEPADSQRLALERHHLAYASAFSLLLLLVLLSTGTSAALRLQNTSEKSSKRKSIFTSMSLYRSLAHMRDVQLERINDSKPACLYAIRLLLILWISLVSLTSQLNFQFLRELLGLRELIQLWPMQLLVNSSLAYDSLILLTAFTYAYQNINANFLDLLKYNAAKYARLAPSIMLMVALTIITPLLYQWRSPVWSDFVEEPARQCRATGLINLTFLQNLLPVEQMCLPQTWIFCVELQLCLLAMPLVGSLNKSFELHHGRFSAYSWPSLALLLAALAGCLFNFVNVYTNSLPAAWFLTFPDKEDKNVFMSVHFQRAWAHLSTFAVGLLAGHLCRCYSLGNFTGRPYGRRCCDTLMWLSSTLVMFALIMGTHSWSLSGRAHLEAPIASALYAALAPLFWSLGLALILFQLTVPNARQQRSALARLLTSDINLVRLGRLTFLAYLINPYVNTFVLAVQEHAIFSSILMLGHTFLGNLVATFALSFLVSALVELPCRRLAKKLLGSRRQCSNLDIIARQLNIAHQGPAHDSFNQQSAAPPPQKHSYNQQQQRQQQQVMIPLK